MIDPIEGVTTDHDPKAVGDDRYELGCLLPAGHVRKYPWYLAWLLRWLQRRCRHYALKADILEGCDRTYAVRWCETCGAHSIVINCCATPIRDCEPTWE